MTHDDDAVLVAGATGNVGGALARQLLAAGRPVRALVRPGSTRPVPAGAVAVEADLTDRAGLRRAYAGVRAAFLLAGYPDMPGILADLRAAGVERVVLLSSGCVPGGDLDNAVVRFNVVSEAAVRDSGLAWTVLRPSGFMSTPCNGWINCGPATWCANPSPTCRSPSSTRTTSPRSPPRCSGRRGTTTAVTA
ncbi:SDR family oxidoreductase [Cryptosporangium arvum]|uniref:SDR family oxidoreductase n=1 Tax=Cryptosporangium arvum TaxID=80871 RepID=UPI0004B5F830|nr:NAD(P)H-binding protein [Cryptosporangium arvum]